MPSKIKPRVPRGMRDILPQKMILRQYVTGEVERVFQRPRLRVGAVHHRAIA